MKWESRTTSHFSDVSAIRLGWVSRVAAHGALLAVVMKSWGLLFPYYC